MFKHSTIAFGKGIDRVVLGNGPRRVLIIVGIHGNEPCGVEAVKLMLQRKALFTGDSSVKAKDLYENDNWKLPIEALFSSLTIEVIIGNPKALEQNTRFLKKNLNRLFDIHMICNDAAAEDEGYTYELQRAKLISESIRCADFVLDIHSTSADVGSFALPSSMDLSEQLAECLPVKYVIESLAHMTLDGGTTVDCAKLHFVPAICVECGQHCHVDIVARAAAVISAFLTMQTSERDSLACCNKHDKPLAMRCEYAERVQSGFEWLNQFPEFSFVPESTPVFRTDERGDVLAPEGGAFIVMPTSHPVDGEEALFWASAK
jgi:predicted deacylase